MKQGDLFPITADQWPPSIEGPPYQRGSATSRAAADAIAPRAGTMRLRTLEAYASMGDRGATREEVAQWQGMRLATVCARVNELVGYGFLEPTGGTRPTTSGRQAEVLRISRAGAAMLLQSG